MKNTSLEAKIGRLTREIREIDEFFYGRSEDSKRDLYADMLERKRDDVVRSLVLQMHTAIEDLLTAWITCGVLGIRIEEEKQARTKSARALRRMLRGHGSLGFDMKLNFAVALRLINSPTQKKLAELNQLRNKCSHNWLLKVPVRQGKRPKQKKPPLVIYKGRDLHGVKALEAFAGEYGQLYLRLFSKAYCSNCQKKKMEGCEL
jgi:hypothetical protein